MRAVLCGYYGQGNGGDEALLASLLQMLPEQVTPIVLSGNPAETKAMYGVTTCDRKSPRLILQALRQSDAFIWGGGSLMQDSTSLASPIYYGGLMGLAQAFGLKTIAWAQGIGPLKHPLTRWITRRAFGNCTAVSVRDQGSAQFLEQWQVNYHQAPDPVWALAAHPVANVWTVPAPRVAVVLRSHSSLTPARLAVLTQALITFQQATQTSIVLVPFQAAQDLAIAQQIQAQLPGASQLVQLSDPQALKGLFQEVEMAIAMRLHGLIMAAAEGCRCFALSYDPKVSQLMQELALPGWDLGGHTPHLLIPDDPQQISQAWVQHYTQGNPLNHLQIQKLIKQAQQHQQWLHEALLP